MGRKRTYGESGDEPELDPSEWAEFGGERYFVIDYTAGGAPIGLKFDEYRAAQTAGERTAGWARALRLLQQATARDDGTHRDIGRMRKIGEGLSRDVYAAAVGMDGRDVSYVVLLPRRDSEPGLGERTRREARLLALLARHRLPLRVPRPLAVLPTPAGPALVREHLAGIPVDLRAGRTPCVRPWALVAEVAAAVHTVATADLGWLASHTTRRAHGLAELDALGEPGPQDDASVHAASAWLRSHLPPDEPAVLVHGDLLGQNILLCPDAPVGLIDWEYATLGDPAWDLAIVTRGVRKPFQIPRGLDLLLDCYNEHAARTVRASEVRFHELCLALRWYRDQQLPTVRQQHLRLVQNLLAWAGQ